MFNDEIEVLRGYASRSAAMGNQHVSNLLNRYAVNDYRQMADEIQAIARGGRLLDWGCGYGHMSYLLRRRGFDVTSLTVRDDNNLCESWNLLMRDQGMDVVLADDDVLLPFEGETFDAVLSCGVLEHVPQEAASVREIARVLRPGGHFFVYQLPNWLSVVEWTSEHLTGIAHDRRYRLREVRDLLSNAALTCDSVRYGSMIPKNLDRLSFLRRLFDRQYRVVAGLDSALLRIPGLNLFSGTWEIVAQKPAASQPPPPQNGLTHQEPDLVTAESSANGAHRG